MNIFGSDYCETSDGLECAECWSYYHEIVVGESLLWWLRGDWRRA